MKTGYRFVRTDEMQTGGWRINIAGIHTRMIQEFLTDKDKGNIPEENAFAMVENMSRVLSNCPNPNNMEQLQNTGIVIGKVQSGKTSNFITLAGLAFDNNYNIVIIFGGTKKNLLKQNTDRIKEYFNQQDDVRILNTYENSELLNSGEISKFLESSKPKIIIVALKHQKHIKMVREVFENTIIGATQPILIIDDEGDEASLNTKYKKGDKSSVYREIIELKMSAKRNSFITVTATPQANILISSFEPDPNSRVSLSPDYGVLCPPGKGYCGLSVFHSAGSPYTVTIPDNEESLTTIEGICTSYQECLYDFFISCGLYQLQNMSNKDKLSMLVNPSPNIRDHDIVYTKTKKILNYWNDVMSNPNDISYQNLMMKIKQYYDNSKFAVICNFETVEKYFCKAVKNCGIHEINGETVSNNNDDNYSFNIYIGGNMLGRGITLKGLAITYNLRETKGKGTVDTIQQRARWFGYKTKVLRFCKIYAPKKVLEQYEDIKEHEDELWDLISTANLEGKRFRNIVRLFSLSNDLNLTRKNVAEAKRYRFHEWKMQKQFTQNRDINTANYQLIQDYFKENSDKEEVVYVSDKALPYRIIRNVELKEFYDFFIERFIFNQNEQLDKQYVKKIMFLLKEKGIQSAKIDIVWMRYDKNNELFSTHSIRDDLTIPNYMIGHRENYRGDREHFNSASNFQIQFHLIKDENNSSEPPCPVFSFRIPNNIISLLTGLVIRPEDDVND